MQQTADIKHWISHMMSIRGWSQAELARRTGVHQTQISRWTRGIAVPDRAHRNVLARAFDVPETDVHMLVGDFAAAQTRQETPQKARAHELIDVMHPAVLDDVLPLLERLVVTGVRS